MGIMDNVLRPHLEAVTKFYKANKVALLLSEYESSINNVHIENLKRHALNRKKDYEVFRQQGNKFYKAQEFDQALQMYTKSIAAAIEGPLASLAYVNRSAALYQMTLYEDCIKDIDRALVCGYPKKQQLYSLYLRKAQCLKFLKKDYASCLADANKAIMDHNKNDEGRRLSELVLRKMEEPPLPDRNLLKPNIYKLPGLSHGQNPEVPSFSSAIGLVHSKKFGRHLIANRNINTSDVLIVEESIVTSICMDVQWNFCNFCFKHCNNLIPCKKCGSIMYCSENCCISDWSTAHKVECNNLMFCPETLAPGKDESHLSVFLQSTIVRLVTYIGLDNIKKTVLENRPIESFVDPRTKGFQDGKFHKVTLEAVLSLEDNFGKLTSKDLNEACHMTLALCSSLGISPDQRLPIGAVLLKLHLIIRFNGASINYFKADYSAKKMPEQMHLGRILFLASSLINHSCNPNVYRVSYGTSVVFRALRPISKGEQITTCYSMPAADHGFKERQIRLLEDYKFQCSCVACVDVNSTPLHRRPTCPTISQGRQWLVNAGFEHTMSPMEKSALLSKIIQYCTFKLPATKPMLPKVLALLQRCHESDQSPNKWYFNLDKIIQNHYKTEGSCFFFGNSKNNLNGKLQV